MMDAHLWEHIAQAGGVLTVMLAVAKWLMHTISTAQKATAAAVEKIRSNDMHHLDQKIDGITATTTRTEEKIDQHIRDHATGAVHGATS